MTLERQKLRAQALADELGSLIEYAARKVLGKATFCMFKRSLRVHSLVWTESNIWLTCRSDQAVSYALMVLHPAVLHSVVAETVPVHC